MTFPRVRILPMRFSTVFKSGSHSSTHYEVILIFVTVTLTPLLWMRFKERKTESTALIPYFLCGVRHAETVFFVLFGSVSDTLASIDFGNPKSIPLVRGKVSPVGSVSASACGRGVHRTPAPLKPLKKYEKWR